MRRDKLYLKDMVEACDALGRFLAGKEETVFLGDELLQSAVLQKLIVIGEAAANLSTDFRKQHLEIEWRDIIGFRNIAVHRYFGIDWEIAWFTATEDVILLRSQIANVLAQEFQDE